MDPDRRTFFFTHQTRDVLDFYERLFNKTLNGTSKTVNLPFRFYNIFANKISNTLFFFENILAHRVYNSTFY